VLTLISQRPDYFVSQFGFFDDWAAGNPIMIGE
jgi:hypothetical protein